VVLSEIINSLENEISKLENDLQQKENEVNFFESKIRKELFLQIQRIKYLTKLYKEQKNSKKVKRQEQKKKGKNYKEVIGIKKIKSSKEKSNLLTTNEREQLKRLYREAVVQVHPDKFSKDDQQKSEQATAITSQLNEIYASGDLTVLKDFYEHIVSGNAMSHIPYKLELLSDPGQWLFTCKEKKMTL
jgi:hypothetical protein